MMARWLVVFGCNILLFWRSLEDGIVSLKYHLVDFFVLVLMDLFFNATCFLDMVSYH